MALTRKRKQRIRRRSRQAGQPYRAEQRALNKQMGRLERQRQRDLASVGGMVDAFADVASDAQRDLRRSGLRGYERRQVAREIANRAADVAQSAPYLRAQIRSEYAPQFGELRSQIAQSMFERRKAVQDRYNELLSAARENKRKRESEKAERRKKRQEALRIAQETAAMLHRVDMADPSSDNYALFARQPDAYWNRLVLDVANSEGVRDPRIAQMVVEDLRRRRSGVGNSVMDTFRAVQFGSRGFLR